MGITSKTFIVVLALAALSLCGLTVWLWPRLAGPGARVLGGRAGLLIGSQLALVAVAAAVCNAYFGFYTSWSDLFGTGSQHYHVNNQGAVPQNVNATQLTSGITAGSVTTDSLTGLRSGITARLRVYVPPQYSDPKLSQQKYPAIVVDATGEPSVAAAVIAALQLPHPITAVVVVVDTPDRTLIPCADQPGGAQGGQFWGQDLRSAIAARYRVGLGAESWGVLGEGPDAYCALEFSLADSSRYSAAAAFGAVTAPVPASQLPVGSVGTPFDAAWWLRTYPAPPSRILLAGYDRPADRVLGPVRAPLQVTVSRDQNEGTALDWLAQTLGSHGTGRP